MDEPFRALSEASLTGLYLLSNASGGVFVYANQALATMFGYRPDELIGRMRAVDLIHPDDRPRVAESIRQRLAGEIDIVRYRVRGLHRDGSPIPVEVHGRRVTYDGRPAVMGTVVDFSEQLQLHHDLRESQVRLEKAQQLAHVGWWAYDLLTKRMVRSAELARIFRIAETAGGYRREDWLRVIHPDDRDRVEELSRAAMRGERTPDCEYRIVLGDGSVRIVSSHNEVVRDNDGGPWHLFGVVQDITELRSAERELRASEERFRTFAEHATEAIFLLDGLGVTLEVNREACESSGYRREELIGRPMIDFYAPEALSVRLQRRAVVAGGAIATFESRSIRKDGTSFPVEIRVRQFEQRGSRFLASARDISERRSGERRTRAHQAVTRILAESATVEDAESRVLQAICEYLEWDVGVFWHMDAETRELRAAAIWCDGARPAPHLVSLLETRSCAQGAGLAGRVWTNRTAEYVPDVPIGAPGLGVEAARRDGLHSIIASPLLLGSEVCGVMTFFSHAIQTPDQHLFDLMQTIGSQIGQFMERKRTEHTLQRSQAEIEHLTRVMTLNAMSSSIAHEIRQPIDAMVTNAETAGRWLAGPTPNLPQVCNALDQIVADGRRAAGVVDRIRALIKRTSARKRAFDINEAIREIVDLTRSEALEHGIAVHTNLYSGLPLVWGDRVQLQQVVLNLTINAFEAMTGREQPRDLRITTSRSGADVVVAVRDSGPGFEPGVRERLFEAFTSTKPGRLGLGLSICRSIVESHGGRLSASGSEPRGSAFEFTVPRFERNRSRG